MYTEIRIRTNRGVEFIDITEKVHKIVKDGKVETGVCYIFCPHTTAGITINENADPSVVRDIISTLDKIVPETYNYRHSEGNSPAHIKATLVGSSVIVFIENNKLLLGTWQGIYFCEFDGPRERQVLVKIIESSKTAKTTE